MQVTYSFPDRLMLDPSLLVAENTVKRTFTEVEENEAGFQFYLPETFVDYLTEYRLAREGPADPILRYYRSRTGLAQLDDVVERINEYPQQLVRFDASDYAEQYEELYRSLHETLPYARDRDVNVEEPMYRESGDLLTDAAFEELVFLLEMSGFVSRTKRLINDAIEAGFTVLETSEEVFDEKVRPHLKDGDQIKQDVCKRIGKWVVVTLGSGSIGLLGGPIAGIISGVTIKTSVDLALLLVFDPA